MGMGALFLLTATFNAVYKTTTATTPRLRTLVRSESELIVRQTRGSVMPKFHYIYLAQNLLKTRFPTSFEQKISRKPGLRQDRSISTCRDRSSGKFSTNKKVGNLVSDKFWAEKKPGLRQVVRQVERLVVRQDRSNGIWALPDTSAVRHFGSKTLRQHCRSVFAEVSQDTSVVLTSCVLWKCNRP